MATKASRRYAIRFGVSMGAYVVLLFLAILLAQWAGSSPWRFAAMALPVPAVLGVVWALLGYVREADELQSKTVMESLAIGFGGGSVTTFTYGLMQIVGAPELNWCFVWVVYGVWWLVGSFAARRRYN
jgi:hypothetical protein